MKSLVTWLSFESSRRVASLEFERVQWGEEGQDFDQTGWNRQLIYILTISSFLSTFITSLFAKQICNRLYIPIRIVKLKLASTVNPYKALPRLHDKDGFINHLPSGLHGKMSGINTRGVTRSTISPFRIQRELAEITLDPPPNCR